MRKLLLVEKDTPLAEVCNLSCLLIDVYFHVTGLGSLTYAKWKDNHNTGSFSHDFERVQIHEYIVADVIAVVTKRYGNNKRSILVY